MIKKYKDFSRKEIRTIATEYATSSFEFSARFFCQRYNISESTFRNILYHAVSDCIVEDDIAKKIAKKSAANSNQKVLDISEDPNKARGARGRSSNKYQSLMLDRKLFNFSNKETKFYAEKFAKARVSYREFASSNAMTLPLLRRTLARAISENLISEEYVVLIEQHTISLNCGKDKDTMNRIVNFYKELRIKRAANLKSN